jgi:hypothetical protein
MLELRVQTEDALLACLLYSDTARETAREMGLEAKHFSDSYLYRPTKARFYKAIMAAPKTGYIAVAEQLSRMNMYYEGDSRKLLSLVELALSVAPDYETYIESVKKKWLDHQIEKCKNAGDYDGLKKLMNGEKDVSYILYNKESIRGMSHKDEGKPWDV